MNKIDNSSESSDDEMPVEVSMKKGLQQEVELRKVAPIKDKKQRINNKVKQSLMSLVDEKLDDKHMQSLVKKEERVERLKKEPTVIKTQPVEIAAHPILANIPKKAKVIILGAKKRFDKPIKYIEKQNKQLGAARLNRRPISELK